MYGIVQATLDALAKRHLVVEKSGFGSRVPKYQQRFCNSEFGSLQFSEKELGLVCGFGAQKYDDDNWRKGYSWRLSFGAMLRHIHAFWRGEDNDPESGLSHLAHAAWHCMVLFTFSRGRDRYGIFDDRQS